MLQPLNRTRSTLFAFAMAACLLSVSLVSACGSEGDGDSYNNHIELTCNGTVIVDETFTSLESCEAFRDSNNFMCGSIELTVNC